MQNKEQFCSLAHQWYKALVEISSSSDN